MADPKPTSSEQASSKKRVQEEDEFDRSGCCFAIGLFLITAGMVTYFWFAHLEQDGGRVRMHVIAALIYGILGKGSLLGIFGGIGVLVLGRGMFLVLKRK